MTLQGAVRDNRALFAAGALLVGRAVVLWMRRPAVGGSSVDDGGVLSSVDAVLADLTDAVVSTGQSMIARVSGDRMAVSVKGLDHLKNSESFRAEKYRDQAGKWTIGYGHLIRAFESFDAPITESRALELLAQDVSDAEDAVNAAVRVPITQDMFDGLVSLAYNIGGGAFAGSTVVRRLNQGNVEGAAEAFAMWNKIRDTSGNLVVSAGLVNRRKADADLFLGVA